MNVFLLLTIIFGGFAILLAISWVVAIIRSSNVKLKFALGYITFLLVVISLIMSMYAFNDYNYSLNSSYIYGIISGCLATLLCILSLVLHLNSRKKGLGGFEIVAILLFIFCLFCLILGNVNSIIIDLLNAKNQT